MASPAAARRPRKPRAGQADTGGASSASPSAPTEDPLTLLQNLLPPSVTPNHLQCPVCRELLNDPRDLPCGHAACFLCLGQSTVSKSGQLQCKACRATHVLGGLGAFGLPTSRLAPIAQQLRSDPRFVRVIKTLPSAPAAPLVAGMPSMGSGPSIYDEPSTPVITNVPSSGDKYADFRALVDTPQPSLVPSQSPANPFAFLNPIATPSAPAPTMAALPVAAPSLPLYDTPAPLPAPIAPIVVTPTVVVPSSSAPLVPSAVPIKPTAAVVPTLAPVPTHASTSAPVAAKPAPAPTPAPAPAPLSPRSANASAASSAPPATPAAAATTSEGSFFARAAALFGSLSVNDAATPAPASAAAPRPDGKPLAAPRAHSFPPELLASLPEAERAKLLSMQDSTAQSSPPPAAAAAAPAPAPAVVAATHDTFMLSAPPQGSDFENFEEDNMFAGLAAGSGAAPVSPTSTSPAPAVASKEPLSRAEYARQKREALKKKKYEEAEQNAIVRKREQEIEQQQRWEMQRAVESQSSSVVQAKLAELQEKTRRENAEREARLKRQKELREEHRKQLLANDPTAAGVSSASVPDASGPLNFAEFAVKETDLRNLFNAWARNLWFAPDDLLTKAIFGPIQAVYCPFFLFDAKTVTQYTAQMCKATEQTTATGEKKMVDTWIPVTGVYKGSYPNILICAAVGEDAKHLCSLKNWDVNKVYYEADGGPRPAASANDTFASKFFKAVVDAIPKVRPLREQLLPAEAWQIVWHEYEEAFVRPVEDRQCSAKILAEERGKGVTGMKIATTYDVTRKLVYLPVYCCSYVYDNKSYRFIVHGQNSSIEADRPYGMGLVSSTAKQGLDALVGLFKK